MIEAQAMTEEEEEATVAVVAKLAVMMKEE
jgi:hypothetical protein